MPPLVSIVIAAYNAGDWAAAAIDSALAQTYPNLEVIVVNDGSTDQTAEVLARYASHPNVRILTQTNQGQAQALNNGFAVSRGEFIKFFDADDLISPQSVVTQVEALASRPRCMAHGIWGRFTKDPKEAQFDPHPGWHDGKPIDWIVETWADTEPMYQCALFLIPRRLLLEAGGWDARLSLILDFEFFTRLILASDGIVFTPEAKLYYRSNLPGSVSRQKSAKAIASGCLACELATEHLLKVEDTPRTRQVAADNTQALLLSFYPAEPAQVSRLLADVDRLGGSTVRPNGGMVFRTLRTLLGWRLALRIREALHSFR